MTACHAGMMNVVAYLCETAGTDKHTRTQNGVTPFFTVCYTGNLRMVKCGPSFSFAPHRACVSERLGAPIQVSHTLWLRHARHGDDGQGRAPDADRDR